MLQSFASGYPESSNKGVKNKEIDDVQYISTSIDTFIQSVVII